MYIHVIIYVVLVPWLATTVYPLLGRYGVPHTKVNGTDSEGGKTETGKETGTEREGQRGWNGTGNRIRGGRHKKGGQRGILTKRCLVLEDVSEYQEHYKGEGAD